MPVTGRNRSRQIIDASPADPEGRRLLPDRQRVLTVDHRLALSNPALVSAPAKNVWSAPALQGFLTAVERSLRKFIRPLASGLLLQPGHDEMRAHRSH